MSTHTNRNDRQLRRTVRRAIAVEVCMISIRPWNPRPDFREISARVDMMIDLD
jgi:hypothetical protein